MTDSQILDGTVVEEPGTALATTEAAPTTLFRTDDPVEVVTRASRVAEALKGVLDKQGLTKNISGKSHVLVEGWTTLGAMVGVTAVPVWTRPLEGQAPEGKSFGWEARVEARTLDGRVIGAAEAMCTRAEGRWKSADDYAIRSMAQTRATSKALRGPLGFVVTLAGYESTPADEMPAEADSAPPAMLTTPQYERIVELFQQAGGDLTVLRAHLDGVKAPTAPDEATRIAGLTHEQAKRLIAVLDPLPDSNVPA